MRLKYSIIIAFTMALIATSANAQYIRKKQINFLKGFSVSAKVGPNYYLGDLVDEGNMRVGFGAAADKEVLNWLSIRAELGTGLLAGKQDGGISFKTTFFDLTLGGNVSLLDVIQGYTSRRIAPYIGLGGGIMMFSAEKTDSRPLTPEQAAIDDWRNVSTGMTMAPLVYGTLGGRYTIDTHWSIIAEFKGCMPFSDDLDGHTGWRRPYSNEAIAELEAAGTPLSPEEIAKGEWVGGDNDFYYSFMVGCSYKFKDMRWKHSTKYNRKVYIRNRKTYKRNAKRVRRR